MIRKPGRRFGTAGRQRGQTLVEAAITIVFFVSLLLGIEEFARALYAYHFVSHAARQATRWAAVNGANCGDDSSCNGTAGMDSRPATVDDITTYVKNLAPAGIEQGAITTSNVCGTAGGTECAESTLADCATTVNDDGCMVKVTVNYTFHFLVPLVGANIPMASTSEMIIAH